MIPHAALPALPAIDGSQGTGVVERIDELLHVTYREADLGNFRDPLEEAIYIILSRQTREAAYQRAYRELRRKWPTWRALASAPPAKIAEIIGPAGFGPSRAEQIQSLLDAVADECYARGLGSRITLDWLHDLDDADAAAFLLSLPGIGPKSARCILHYSLDRDTFAVDTNVRRTFHRLGLVENRGGKVTHAEYEDLVAPRMRRRLHVNLIHHGRQLCRAGVPRCSDCPLISFCATGRATLEGDSRPTVVELFGGAGGLGLGFKRAGFRIAVAVELDRAAAQTYRANHRGTVVVERDVRGVSGEAIRAAFPLLGDVSAVIGGPPCQGYSAAGKRDPEHHKNHLFREQVRIASELDARFVVIENVPGMRGVAGVQFVDKVENALREAGYHPNAGIVRASDYGVPQLRSRLIFTAQRLDRGDAPSIPVGSFCGSLLPECRCGRPTPPTVIEELQRIPTLDAGEEAEYRELPDGTVLLNASTMAHSERVTAKIARIEAGKGPISYRRLHADLARTIVAGHRALPVHPTEDRTISAREAALIQGFPLDHVFCGAKWLHPLQIANAVPPPLAEALARSVNATMMGSNHPALEQDLCGLRQLGPAAARPQPGQRSRTAG